jgi:transposase
MTLRPQPFPPVPEDTVAAVPKGNLYVALRAEFGTLYGDQLFTDLYPPSGRPVQVAPWRLALVMVRQYADAIHRRAHRSPGSRCGPPLHGLRIVNLLCAELHLRQEGVSPHRDRTPYAAAVPVTSCQI